MRADVPEPKLGAVGRVTQIKVDCAFDVLSEDLGGSWEEWEHQWHGSI